MTRTSSLSLSDRERAAWLPILCFAYGATLTSAIGFLGAGFRRVHALQSALGGFVPDRQLHAITGSVVLLIVSSLAARRLAESHIRAMPDSASVARRAGSLLLLAVFLALPPARYLTFGSNSPAPTQVVTRG